MKSTYGGGVYEGEKIVINEQSKASEKVIEMVGFEKVALQQRLHKFLFELNAAFTIFPFYSIRITLTKNAKK